MQSAQAAGLPPDRATRVLQTALRALPRTTSASPARTEPMSVRSVTLHAGAGASVRVPTSGVDPEAWLEVQVRPAGEDWITIALRPAGDASDWLDVDLGGFAGRAIEMRLLVHRRDGC
jgi:hypothetical protein